MRRLKCSWILYVKMSSEASSATVLAVLDRGGTIGMGYLGVSFSSMCVFCAGMCLWRLLIISVRWNRMYGLTCLQTFQYYRSDMTESDLLFTRYFVRATLPAGLWYTTHVCLPLFRSCDRFS